MDVAYQLIVPVLADARIVTEPVSHLDPSNVAVITGLAFTDAFKAVLVLDVQLPLIASA